MYNVKGPSKMVAKTARRGISQNMDNIREYTRHKSMENEEDNTGTLPKPVFNSKKPVASQQQRQQEPITPEHEEVINFISESWNTVWTDSSAIYYEDEQNSFLDGFKPFDLESWWGKRMFAMLTGSGTSKN